MHTIARVKMEDAACTRRPLHCRGSFTDRERQDNVARWLGFGPVLDAVQLLRDIW